MVELKTNWEVAGEESKDFVSIFEQYLSASIQFGTKQLEKWYCHSWQHFRDFSKVKKTS
jgi:hypothetical protein